MTIQSIKQHTTSLNKPPRKTIKSSNSSINSFRSKGSKNCPACFKKKIKCNHLQELCAKTGNFKTPMNGYFNRILFDSFKFDPKDRAKLDAIIINQVNNFTRNISPQACANADVYKDELQKTFYDPIIKQFEKIAIERVEVKDDISISSEEDSSNGRGNNDDDISPQLSIVDSVLYTKSAQISQPSMVQTLTQSKGKLVRIKIGEFTEIKTCYLSLENFSNVNALKQAIETACNFRPIDIKYESFYDRKLTVCDGYLLDCLKTKFTNAPPSELVLHCTI